MRLGFSSLRASRFIGVLAACALAVGSSQAQVTISFENLPTGTLVTNQYPGVTFSSTPGKVNFVMSSLPPRFICTGTSPAAPSCTEDTYLDFASPVSNLHFGAVQ